MGFSGEGQIWRFFKCARALIHRFGDFFSTKARTVPDGAALWQELFYNLLVFGLELIECCIACTEIRIQILVCFNTPKIIVQNSHSNSNGAQIKTDFCLKRKVDNKMFFL